MAPLRPTDAPGAKVMPPTPELFPSGSWEKPWVAGENGDDLLLTYQAGGAHATIEGEGAVALDAEGVRSTLNVPGAGLYELAGHPRHGGHQLVLRPDPSLRIWSVSFSAGMP